MSAINDKKLSQNFFRYLAYRHYFFALKPGIVQAVYHTFRSFHQGLCCWFEIIYSKLALLLWKCKYKKL